MCSFTHTSRSTKNVPHSAVVKPIRFNDLVSLRNVSWAMCLTLIIAFSGLLQGQTLKLYYQGNVLNPNATTYIDRAPSMPNIKIFLADACGTLTYFIDIDFTDGAGHKTSSQVGDSIPCGQTRSINWSPSAYFEGGKAVLYWWVTYPTGYSSPTQSFTFFVFGMNPTNAQVNSLAYSPWFFENIISWESGAWTENPPGQYKQFHLNGAPLDCGCPYGVGLTSVDPPFDDGDYWNWQENLGHGADRLAGVATPALTAWNNEYAQMRSTNGGTTKNPDDYAIDPNCDFQYPVHGGDSFVDANQIKMYNRGAKFRNGAYQSAFIFWDPPVGGQPGRWDYVDTYSNYVHNVCSHNVAT